jgi:hypothetical protein
MTNVKISIKLKNASGFNVMNIFVTDNSPKISAQTLDDKRVVKMVLETAQLLSTAIFINTFNIYEGIYKPTHIKHPCAIWAGLNIENWDWLFQHFIALCEEYTMRYNKIHASEKLLPYLIEYRKFIKHGAKTPFANCTRSEPIVVDFRYLNDTCDAYKKYLVEKWNNDKSYPKWTKRDKPLWYDHKSLSNLNSNNLIN